MARHFLPLLPRQQLRYQLRSGLRCSCCGVRFNALDITTGKHKEGSPTTPVAGSRTFPDSDFPNNATNFVAIKQLQRPGESQQSSAVRHLFMQLKASRADQMSQECVVPTASAAQFHDRIFQNRFGAIKQPQCQLSCCRSPSREPLLPFMSQLQCAV